MLAAWMSGRLTSKVDAGLCGQTLGVTMVWGGQDWLGKEGRGGGERGQETWRDWGYRAGSADHREHQTSRSQ